MIKLERGKKPEYLSNEKQKELTDKFKSNPKATVWKHQSIGEALLKSSNFKCAYCECELQKTDSYMQVEHFKDKKRYPDDVIEWDNLLPSCQRCNNKKRQLDVVAKPIINPYIDNPKSHLSLKDCYLYKKDDKGDTTIKKLDLNEDERLVFARFMASNEITKRLNELEENIEKLTFIRNGIAKTLSLCQPNKPFSAFVSFSLIHNQDYQLIKQTLIDNDLWDDDLKQMDEISHELALDPR